MGSCPSWRTLEIFGSHPFISFSLFHSSLSLFSLSPSLPASPLALNSKTTKRSEVNERLIIIIIIIITSSLIIAFLRLRWSGSQCQTAFFFGNYRIGLWQSLPRSHKDIPGQVFCASNVHSLNKHV